jgi:hypothetical protein
MNPLPSKRNQGLPAAEDEKRLTKETSASVESAPRSERNAAGGPAKPDTYRCSGAGSVAIRASWFA